MRRWPETGPGRLPLGLLDRFGVTSHSAWIVPVPAANTTEVR